MRRITLIAAGGVRLSATLPAAAPAVPLVVRTCHPRDQQTSGEHRHVFFVRKVLVGEVVYVQAELLEVPCEAVEVEQ